MRIGLLTTSFPRHEGDTAGPFVLGFARALVDAGHTVEVLAPEPARGAAPPAWHGVAVRWVPYARPRALARTFYGAGAPENLARDPLAWAGLVPFAASLLLHARTAAARWDALVSHWAVPSALVAGAVRGRRRHLAVFHSADVHLLERAPRRVAQRVDAGATALLFASRDLRARFLDRLPPEARGACAGKAHVGAMGIDPAPRTARAHARARLGLPPRGAVLLVMARLVPIKGVDLAVRAAARLGATLVVAGDGPERRALEALARAERADARFLGHVVGAAKADALGAADVFLAPSRALPSGRTEGTPTAVLEALAAGLPVVASRTGGLPEVVTPAVGALVPPDAVEPLVREVARLCADPRGRAALRRAARRRGAAYAWAAVGPRFAALVDGVTDAPSACSAAGRA